MSTTTRWCIRVTYPSGYEAFVRHGRDIGHGPIVQFRTRRDAEANLDFIRQGLEQETTAAIVPYRREMEV